MSDHDSEAALDLVGLDGSNPLGFLAALGTIRSATAAFPERDVRISWKAVGGWRPRLGVRPSVSREELVGRLRESLLALADNPIWTLGPDLTVAPAEFRSYASLAAKHALKTRDRSWADYAAAFGCDAMQNDNGTIQDTALRTMSGAGHQHFLGFMVNIIRRTEAQHLDKALFQVWRYDDPLDNQNLRWDPSDDVRRALRWRDPSGDPQRRKRGGMLGANRLAIEGLPLLPAVPVRSRQLSTTGFSGRGSGGTYWTWPIWTSPLTVDVVRSVLALPQIQTDPDSAEVRRRGVAEVFRSRRLTVGKFRCFTPGEPV